MKRVSVIALGAAALILATAASAHHSFAMFDNNRQVTLEGTIKDFQWTNPHCWVQLLVTDASGKSIEWSIEGSSPNNLVRRGWSRQSLKPGDKAAVIIHPLKTGEAGGSLMQVTIGGVLVGDPPGQS